MLLIGLVIVGLVVPSGLLGLSRRDARRSEQRTAVVEGGTFAAGPLGGMLGARLQGASFGTAGAVEKSVAPPSPAKRRALIVGIANARGGRPLPGSITDAKNLRAALLAYGFEPKKITMLLERDATATNIRRHLDVLAKRTPRDGVAVFAVATHTRRRAGRNELLTYDGGRISSSELASRLGRVRSRMWVALPTCYAEGYAVPGIVGPKRVATFASPSDEQTYQLGSAGSYLFINMVRRGMLEGRAPASVESAFRFAQKTLKKEAPNRVPRISDGIKGDLILGRFSGPTRTASDKPQPGGEGARIEGPVEVSPPDANDPSQPPPAPGRRKGLGICGPLSYNCSHE